MRPVILVLAALILAGCADEPSGSTPAERARRAPPMSEDVWKIYGGTESGVTGDKTDEKTDAKTDLKTDASREKK
jgi:curli biogenesis system outer membrane secretion channel CsgG